MRLLHCCGLKLACSHAVGAPATGGAAAQANPSLVMSGGVAVAAAHHRVREAGAHRRHRQRLRHERHPRQPGASPRACRRHDRPLKAAECSAA